MQQISLRHAIYVVIGFAVFFALVSLALKGNQFCQVIALAGASLIPLLLIYACVFLFCQLFASAFAPVKNAAVHSTSASTTSPSAPSNTNAINSAAQTDSKDEPNSQSESEPQTEPESQVGPSVDNETSVESDISEPEKE